MRSGAGWVVTRTGRTVRIDLNAGLDTSEDATTAIIAATLEHLLDKDVSEVQIDGSALGQDLPGAFPPALAKLAQLAERYNKDLIVGPI
jgi:hypothetical protein